MEIRLNYLIGHGCILLDFLTVWYADLVEKYQFRGVPESLYVRVVVYVVRCCALAEIHVADVLKRSAKILHHDAERGNIIPPGTAKNVC